MAMPIEIKNLVEYINYIDYLYAINHPYSLRDHSKEFFDIFSDAAAVMIDIIASDCTEFNGWDSRVVKCIIEARENWKKNVEGYVKYDSNRSL